MDEDRRLINAIQEGSEEAFEQLFFKYYEALCQFSCQYVESMTIAEGLVQEVWTDTWKNRKSLKSIKNIRSYLYKAVKNESLDYLKHQKVVQKYEREVEFEIYGEVHTEKKESLTKDGFIKAAQNAIEELPEHTRDIYKMSRRGGLTYREIADVLDISIKTVEYHISKALRILRDRLSPYIPILLLSLSLYEFVA